MAMIMISKFEKQIFYLNHQLNLLQEKEEEEKEKEKEKETFSSLSSSLSSSYHRKRQVLIERLNHFHRKKDKFLKFIQQQDLELQELDVIKANQIQSWEC